MRGEYASGQICGRRPARASRGRSETLSSPTVDLGARLLGRNSIWTIVGLGGGRHDFRHGSIPYGCSVSIPYWGSRVELMEVIAMAQNGLIHAETTEFPLIEAADVYEKLKAGEITGRGVLVPQ